MIVEQRNLDGKLEKIIKDGKTVYNADKIIYRGKISDESRQVQRDAIANNNTQKRLENLEKIIFGKRIHNE